MLTPGEIEDRLFALADSFLGHMYKGQYRLACLDYDKARAAADVVGLDPERMALLFGDRQQDPPMEGAFPERMVLLAQEKYIIQNCRDAAEEAARRRRRRM